MKLLKYTLIHFVCFFALGLDIAKAEVTYGDLYNIEWCPCNDSDNDAAVTMGRVVMCPCDGSYTVIKKRIKKPAVDDTKKAEETNKKPEYNYSYNNNQPKVNYSKFYIGLDYIVGKTSSGEDKTEFSDPMLGGAKISADLNKIIDDQDSISFVIGSRINKYFGLEAFYQQTFEDNHFSQIDNETLNSSGADYTDYHLMNNYVTSFKAYGLDAIGYLPVTPYFDFVGSLGLAQYNFRNKATFNAYYLDQFDPRGSIEKDFDDDTFGIRAGLGAQVNIADGVALRLMYRYIHVGGDFIDNLNEFSFGVRFLF